MRDGLAERVGVRRGRTDFESVESSRPLAAGDIVLARGRDGAALLARVAEP